MAYREQAQTSKCERETSTLHDRLLILQTDAPTDGLGDASNSTLAFMSYLSFTLIITAHI